ncbi:hypothetical protein chiPu_0030533, partial [Chiloscyllium punctatum]|nr:hypothetical protein [Chiloscyllium punctatum]
SLPLGLRTVRTPQKQPGLATASAAAAGGGTGAKSKAPGTNLAPSGHHEPAGTGRGGCKLPEGTPESAQQPGLEGEEAASVCDPPEERVPRLPTAEGEGEEEQEEEEEQGEEEQGEEVSTSGQPCLQREAGPQHQALPGTGTGTGTPGEERAPHAASPPDGEERAARSVASPVGYTSKSTNTEITFKKEPTVRTTP